MLQGLIKRPESILSREAPVEKRWAATRVLADLLSRGPNLGSLTGAWTANRVELVRHIRHWVFVAAKARAKKIAEQVANISYRSKSYSEAKRKWKIDGPYTKQLRKKYVVKALAKLADDEVLEAAPSDHPVVNLFREVNPVDTHFSLNYELELMSCATGNEYIWMPPDGYGLPSEMWVVPSHWVWPIVGSDRIIEAYEIRPVEGGFKRLVFPADEMLHMWSKSPISKIDGYSPLYAISRWVDSSESIDQSRWATFKQGAFSSGVISLGAEYFDPTDEDINRIEMKFLQRYMGERRSGKPIILPPGMEFTPLMMSAREMDFVQSADQLRDFILSAFDVPKFIVGISQDVQRNTSEAAMFQFAIQGLNPTLEGRGQAMTKWFRRHWDEIVIWYDDVSPDDAAQMNSDITTDGAQNAIMINDILEARGRPQWGEKGNVTPQEYMMLRQEESSARQQQKQQEMQQQQMAQQGGGMPGMEGQEGDMGGGDFGEMPSLDDLLSGAADEGGGEERIAAKYFKQNGNGKVKKK